MSSLPSTRTRRTRRKRTAPRRLTCELEEFPSKLRLVCSACSRSGSYQVGAVLILPEYFEKQAKEGGSANAGTGTNADGNGGADAFDEHVGFTRYFRCKHCNAGGPWRLAPLERWRLLFSLMLTPSEDMGTRGVHVCEPRTFDGQVALTPMRAEEIVREHLSREPENPFLWTRLGNLYKSGGRLDLARPAYERAVELDLAHVEAHAMLADALEKRRATRMSLRHWKAVLQHARHATQVPRKLRLELVSAALDGTLALTRDPNEMFQILCNPGQKRPSDEPEVIHLTTIDLSDEDDWDAVCRAFLGEPFRRPHPDVRRTSTKPPPWMSVAAPRFVSDDPMPDMESMAVRMTPRNAPCPCGSGRKFKKCCGRE